MSPKQKALYWTSWQAAKRAGQLADPDRHRLMFEALGYAASSKSLTNDEFDKVLGAFRAISQPTNLRAQVRQIDQPRTRLLHRIRDQFACLSLFVEHPSKYVAAILRDRFKASEIEALRHVAQTCAGTAQALNHTDSVCSSPDSGLSTQDSELVCLRNTLARCLSSFRRKSSLTEHDMCQRANVECFRPNCALCRDSKPRRDELRESQTISDAHELQTADPF